MRFRTAVAVIALSCAPPVAAQAADPAVDRGKYLVNIAGCNDCHTPGYFLGKPDMASFLGGSEVGFEIPGLGTFHGPNLTPDKATGLGGWTDAQIVAALQTGVRPDGRMLAPIMPWHAFGGMTDNDIADIFAHLSTLTPVAHRVTNDASVAPTLCPLCRHTHGYGDQNHVPARDSHTN